MICPSIVNEPEIENTSVPDPPSKSSTLISTSFAFRVVIVPQAYGLLDNALAPVLWSGLQLAPEYSDANIVMNALLPLFVAVAVKVPLEASTDVQKMLVCIPTEPGGAALTREYEFDWLSDTVRLAELLLMTVATTTVFPTVGRVENEIVCDEVAPVPGVGVADCTSVCACRPTAQAKARRSRAAPVLQEGAGTGTFVFK